MTKTIKTTGKNGKVVTHVVHSVRIVKRSVLHNITNSETITTPGGTKIVTTSTTRIVPVIRVKNKVVTVNGKPVTIAQTVTDMQTQTQSITQTLSQTQTVSQTQTIENNNTQYVTVTNTQTQTLAPDTVTQVSTVVVTETTPAVTETVTETVTVPTATGP